MSPSAPPDIDPWKETTTLRELYHGEQMSMREVGEELGCSVDTIAYWMEKLGVPTRSKQRCRLETRPNGYEVVRNQHDGVRDTLFIHKLCAVAWTGEVPEAVRHENGVPWDNREENLETTTKREHAERHLA